MDQLLSPQWLTLALGGEFPGVRVTSVTRGPVVSWVSTNIRFHFECEGGVPDSLLADLCAKCNFSETGWPARRTGAVEAYFYRDLASRTDVLTPRGFYADVHPESGHGILITEDVAAPGATFLDALRPVPLDTPA